MTEPAPLAERLVIRPAGPGDREPLARLLAGLSPESSYSRFLTGSAATVRRTLLDALLPTEPAAGALLGFVDGEPVAHALWVRLRPPDAAEIAVVVADLHQRRGIGSALVRALATEVAKRGIERIQVVSSSTNRAVARMVQRGAPGAPYELDGPTLTYWVAVPPVAARRAA